MYEGYIYIAYFENDSVETAWKRAAFYGSYSVHSELESLLKAALRLPCPDLIGVCSVKCPRPIKGVEYIRVGDIYDVSYLGRPNEIEV